MEPENIEMVELGPRRYGENEGELEWDTSFDGLDDIWEDIYRDYI